MTAVVLQPHDFDKLIRELKSHITDEIKAAVKPAIEKPLCIKEAADYLNITRQTFHKRLKKGMYADITHRDDGSVHFFASELYQYLKQK